MPKISPETDFELMFEFAPKTPVAGRLQRTEAIV